MRWPPNKTWTSARKREGYRHFELKQYGGKGSERWAEPYPVLQKELRLRISIGELKDQNEWVSGWQQLPKDECCDGTTDDMTDVSTETH